MARHLEVVEVPAGTEVVREGEPGDAFYVVLEGSAVVTRKGRRAGVLGQGDRFGELALLDPAPRAATVRADGDMVVGVLGHRMFKVLLREVPGLSAQMLASLAADLRDAHAARAV